MADNSEITKSFYGELFTLNARCWEIVFSDVRSRVNSWINSQANASSDKDLRRRLSDEFARISARLLVL